MQERLDTIRQNIDAIRKSGKLSHWRMVYAENLLNRAGEYLAVDRLPEAGRVAEKLERWINSHTPRVDKSERFSENPMVFWNADMLLAMSAKLKQTLLEKRQLVPSTERDSTIRRLTLVEGWIREGQLLQAHDELLALRTALIARLRRSFRARLVATDLYRGTASVPAGSLVGPYNALHTLEETFHVVGERDPIWVEDFLEIYNDLFRVVERLVPQDKK
ncbi:hypothetical protein SAMN05720760_102228 [Fibrobacter sp. UWB8]|jgi:hypothetical protein|uniref:hypothetical protein n=1 Tax=unclassified Fibrobacter TaxID=2634177 RepID=UPI0009131C8F|nr:MULTISPECIES: hypothetical protein [unclassified Fibrobacter]PWJ65637.1 hypothetical protein BGW99_10340 [Fibrobacter sp. UWB6]SHF97118.1 hypothetical protein SAMN05720760_102228 [Fibrobacter sp. UWB8]